MGQPQPQKRAIAANIFPIAADIALAPFVEAEFRQEQVRQDAHDAEVRRASGVAWSGMGPGTRTPRSRDQVLQAAEARRARHEAYMASPRGRLFAAIKALFEVGYTAEADRLRGLYDRELADDREPLNYRAVGAALAILNPIAGSDARDARAALAELLMGVPANPSDHMHGRAA